VEIIPPESIVELMSTQYRYVALQREGGFVRGYDLWSGIKFEATNMFTEQMTAWAVTKKDYYPRQHSPAKQMWRDFSALVPHKANDSSSGGMKWIARLQGRNISLPLLRLNIAGIEYKNDTAVKDVFSDSLQVNAALLSKLEENDAGWVIRITKELEMTKEVVDRLGDLASNIFVAALGDNDDKNSKKRRVAEADNAKEKAYFRLDEPFRTWLAAINPLSDDIEEKCGLWRNTLKNVILRLGEELVSEAGTRAFIGRETKNNQRKELITAPKSYIKFKNAISRVLKDEKGG
jgi:CRISPR system Cascade subunit CasA